MRIYVAGPLHGSGSYPQNIRNAVRLGAILEKAGHTPFVPHLYGTWEQLLDVRDQRVFMRMDLAWLSVCHALVRLPGASPGADEEVAFARRAGLPVFEVTSSIIDIEYLCNAEGRLAVWLEHVQPAIQTLGDLQDAVGVWAKTLPYYATQRAEEPALGVVEELGELLEALVAASMVRGSNLTRAILKSQQGTRGTREEHLATIEHEIGDILVFAAGFAHAARGSLRHAVQRAVDKIRARDYVKYPRDGRAA